MKIKGTILSLTLLMVSWLPSPAFSAEDKTVYLNAFTETSTAYLNDAFLLVGSTADNLMTESLSRDAAFEIVANVQKRIRIVRAKMKLVLLTDIRPLDRKLLSLLESSYACLDQQTWALMMYIREYSPSAAKRFEERRAECLARIETVAAFYASLPPAPEFPEPLSTR
ncbi:MAG: hypothetical protein QG577_154 [Thermodesulfobacteriota bacterium]|nr:hypothetical protein [Thermodesulfobacteriota bacterium]